MKGLAIIFLIMSTIGVHVNSNAQNVFEKGIVLEVIIGDLETSWYFKNHLELNDTLIELGPFLRLKEIGGLNFYTGSDGIMIANCCELGGEIPVLNIESNSIDSNLYDNYTAIGLEKVLSKLERSNVRFRIKGRKIIVRSVFVESINCECYWPYEPGILTLQEANIGVFIMEIKMVRGLNYKERKRLKKIIEQIW